MRCPVVPGVRVALSNPSQLSQQVLDSKCDSFSVPLVGLWLECSNISTLGQWFKCWEKNSAFGLNKF